MTTKLIFNVPLALKQKAAQKAKISGLSLSTVLNSALKAYVENRIGFDLFEKELVQAKAEKKAGKGISSKQMMKLLSA